jgi:hypothetical protein
MRELLESDAIMTIVDDDPSVLEGSQWFDQVEE